MPTAYSQGNQSFSDNAHVCAQAQIYPELFNVKPEQLKFTSTSLSLGAKEKILDGEMAIDRIVSVKVRWFRADIEFTIQERFRRKKYAKHKDITITEWNKTTDMKSELFKLNAGIFVYGYYDDEADNMLDWIAFNTAALLHSTVVKCPFILVPPITGKAPTKRENNPRSNQDFLTFTFDYLEKSGFVIGRKK